MIRFLHAADLHLGMRVTRFDENACNRIGEARFTALEQLRVAAAEHRVDFILIAGDVFDDHSVSHRIAERAFELFEGKSVPCPVYVLPGNHDPLIPGGVWDRDPWTREQPAKHTYLFREAAPLDLPGLPVTIYPCPLRGRNSIDDPTAWIANHPRTPSDSRIRIGFAHGSLNVLPNLPEDDHLIRADAAYAYGLDYLALGHWHKRFLHKAADGSVRAAYSGTHEPMRFGDSGASGSAGWSPYSGDGDAERFQDAGVGTALVVTIDEAGAPPSIETIEVGWLRWSAERRDLTSIPIGQLVSDYAQREFRERTLLRLILFGVVEPRTYARIDEELLTIVRNRYHDGSYLNADEILIEPDAEQAQKIVGDGVLSRMLERLKEEAKSSDPGVQHVARHALKLLCRLAWEASPQ